MAYAFRFPADVTALLYSMRDWQAEARRAFWLTPPSNREEKERRKHRNNFMMDFENSALARWDSSQGIPTGPARYEHHVWATHMQEYLQDSDECWEEYVAWVQSGWGDEWFQEE